MIVAQADPGFDLSDATRTSTRNARTLVETDGLPDGFVDYLLALRAEVIAFQRPVAYVHGDSHYFRIDRPFLDSAGRRLENFTRVETFGDNAANSNNDVQWLKVLVDPHSREVFAYQAQIVPANRVAVPAPPPLPRDHDHDRLAFVPGAGAAGNPTAAPRARAAPHEAGLAQHGSRRA